MTRTDGAKTPAGAAQESAEVNPVPPGEEPDDDLFGDDVFGAAWDKPARVNRLSWVLLAAIVAVLAFAGGVVVQKSHDAALVSGSGRARAYGGGSGQGGGGQGGYRQGGAGQGGGGGDSGGADAGGTGQPPVAIGTIDSVAAQSLAITDLGGNKITVNVPRTAAVTTPGLAGPTAGERVSVVGTKAPDGSVTATAVTVRAPGG